MSIPSILIVEDEVIVSMDISIKLQKLGYQVAGVTNTGEEAVQFARRQPLSLILMDIHLAGEIDGVEAADIILQECQVPVIFLTALSDKATINRALHADAFGYIIKPFDDRDLHTQIEIALYKHAADQRLRESESRFRLLSETAGQLLTAGDPQDVINMLCRQVMEHLDCHAFFNFMVDGDMGRLQLNSYAGIPEEEAQKIKFLEYGVAVCGCAAQEGCRIVAENIATTSDPRTELVKSYGIQAYACHPLMAEGRVIGTLSFGTKTRSLFSPQDLSLMKTVADQVATAMERIRLIGELKKSRDELEIRVLERTDDLLSANERLFREINERKRADAALRESQEQLIASNETLTMVIDGITEPIIMLDEELKIKKINRAAKDYYGLNNYQEAVGKLCFEAFCRKSSPCVDCEYPISNLQEKAGSFERKGAVNPDRIEQVFVYPVKDASGTPEATIIRIADITQMRMLNRQIIQSEKLASLGMLVSGIAHEINNPNNFIMFNIPVLRRYLEIALPIVKSHAAAHADFTPFGMSFEEYERDLFELTDSIQKGSERIKNIVSELKDFSYLGDQIEAAWENPEQTIAQAIRFSRVHVKERVNRFDVNIPEDLPDALFEARGLEQVIVNILINAAQAADKEDSWVKLNVGVEHEETEKPYLVIEIKDNGCGIDENGMTRIFDPFYHHQAPGVGTGLGLYVCHNLIEKMGGSIEVNSRVGKGSTFRVMLLCR